ncbi:hypothetical protein BKA62DRAFT_670209 [Auriculariales sp. MPI-PUGE-AT-0066]|nr:hypothetical protein BKA62DRAFT_670209 [Auriculariales sp. MPI-PUGE-AT-0066]
MFRRSAESHRPRPSEKKDLLLDAPVLELNLAAAYLGIDICCSTCWGSGGAPPTRLAMFSRFLHQSSSYPRRPVSNNVSIRVYNGVPYPLRLLVALCGDLSPLRELHMNQGNKTGTFQQKLVASESGFGYGSNVPIEAPRSSCLWLDSAITAAERMLIAADHLGRRACAGRCKSSGIMIPEMMSRPVGAARLLSQSRDASANSDRCMAHAPDMENAFSIWSRNGHRSSTRVRKPMVVHITEITSGAARLKVSNRRVSFALEAARWSDGTIQAVEIQKMC